MSIRIQDATAGGYAAGSYDGGPDEAPDLGPEWIGRRRTPGGPVIVRDPGTGLTTEEGRERQERARAERRSGERAERS